MKTNGIRLLAAALSLSLGAWFSGCGKANTSTTTASNVAPIPTAINPLSTNQFRGQTVAGGCAQASADGTYNICYDIMSSGDGTVTASTVQSYCQQFSANSGVTYATVAACSLANIATECSSGVGTSSVTIIELVNANMGSAAVTQEQQDCQAGGNEVIY